ncbi:MAG: hypothetical protein AMS27_14305 [Bacteroides sp. SM23_62_1]|nr:MAG: hypothetical protein AMS27_14305 [Bacteroides sp. SM23_62_1]
MEQPSREFQIFAKPVGPRCNLNCHYCYYLEKVDLYPGKESIRMPGNILEEYIIQHIDASTEPVINFSWHGGEPTLAGLDYFKKVVELQHRHQPSGKRIVNGIQTNGTLLDDEWCRFFAQQGFAVGISIDGPKEFHDCYRLTRDGKSTFEKTLNGYRLLQHYGVMCEILCVVNAHNVHYPLEVYRFFRQLHAKFITFLPLVDYRPDSAKGVGDNTVPSEAFGQFLCSIFDEWLACDIGQVKVQIFEEAARTAFGQEHTLCIFKKTCGGVPVVEHNGDLYSCDHFVDEKHHLGNIQEIPLTEFLDSKEQKTFGQAKLNTLPRYCLECEVRDMCNGECPKNRFIKTPDGESGLNYLCVGYKKFFMHCRLFVNEVAALWRQQNINTQKPHDSARSSGLTSRVGRNDPCPCGSGKKYKNCCMWR